MARNPVMFVVEIGSVVTTIVFFAPAPSVFVGSITLWLWSTVLFANFAEAVAEGRGKAQADTLRKTRQETVAYVRQPDGTTGVPSSQLQVGDLCVVDGRPAHPRRRRCHRGHRHRSTSRPSPASRRRSSASRAVTAAR